MPFEKVKIDKKKIKKKIKRNRPDKYKREMCEIVVECGKKGYTLAEIAYKLDIDKDTLYKFKKEYPEFDRALKKAKTLAEAYMLEMMKKNIENKDFSVPAWTFLMRNTFGFHSKQYQEKVDNSKILPLKSVKPLDKINEIIDQYSNGYINLVTAERAVKLIAVVLDEETRRKVDLLLDKIKE